MVYLKRFCGGLVILTAILAITACNDKASSEKTRVSVDKIREDLANQKITVEGMGEFHISNDLHVELKESRNEGKLVVSSVLLKAIDAKAKTGIQGELVLTYHNENNVLKLNRIETRSTKKMEEHYATRLSELVAFPLHFAANIGDVGKVEHELKKGVPVDLPEEKKQSTALMFAAERGFSEITGRLVASGASINHQNRYGFTALHAAVNGNQLEVAKFLVKNGAKIDAQDQLGQTPLYFAAERGHLELIRFLVENRADVNQKSKKGWPPLYAATSSNSLEGVKYLIEHGATVNDKTTAGSHSPLLVAAFNNNTEMVRLLLDSGADVSARLSSKHSGFQNQTALDIAKKQGNSAVVALLEKKTGR